MMLYDSLGFSVSRLKQKLILNQYVKPAANNFIINTVKNDVGEASTNLMAGFNASPLKMAKTLSEDITKLSTEEQNLLFTNLKNGFTGTIKKIQGAISQVPGKGKESIDYYMKKIYLLGMQNGLDITKLVKR